jgi:hypothetical protein
MRKVLGVCAILVLFLFAAPTPLPAADSFSRGNPCHAERTTYYSDATYSQVVGVDEYICWEGHRITGQRTIYYVYEYICQCCSVCTSRGVCGVEP